MHGNNSSTRIWLGSSVDEKQARSHQLSGWGHYPRHTSAIFQIQSAADLLHIQRGSNAFVARGNGRSYGDAAIGQHATLFMGALNRVLEFNRSTGELIVEAGALLADILAITIPEGFFLPVVPGTKLVSVGGMVAADVHGKNHARCGGFGDHVCELKLALISGEIVTCSRAQNSELFAATVGGMGLTGTIVQATLRLLPIATAWMRSHVLAAPDLDGTMAIFEQSRATTYCVAWIDGLASGGSVGRSLVSLGDHATRDDLLVLNEPVDAFCQAKPQRIALPFDMPFCLVNARSVAAFNAIYFRRGMVKSAQRRLLSWDRYFFPLDVIGSWNRLYGRCGFVQHQCAIPADCARPVIGEILERISRGGHAPSLVVMKRLGQGGGLMSFPLPGYTLSIDFPVRPSHLKLLDEIDRLVVSAGGRICLAKDARQSRDTFESGYQRLSQFRELRRAVGADRQIQSRLSARLGI